MINFCVSLRLNAQASCVSRLAILAIDRGLSCVALSVLQDLMFTIHFCVYWDCTLKHAIRVRHIYRPQGFPNRRCVCGEHGNRTLYLGVGHQYYCALARPGVTVQR